MQLGSIFPLLLQMSSFLYSPVSRASIEREQAIKSGVSWSLVSSSSGVSIRLVTSCDSLVRTRVELDLSRVDGAPISEPQSHVMYAWGSSSLGSPTL